MHWLFSFLIFCSDSKMVGSIVSDLEVDALTNVVAKLKIEVRLLTACLWNMLVAAAPAAELLLLLLKPPCGA